MTGWVLVLVLFLAMLAVHTDDQRQPRRWIQQKCSTAGRRTRSKRRDNTYG